LKTPLMTVPPFANTLKLNGIDLVRAETHTLQVNVGLLCNQTCRHCHLEAGPDCRETMRGETVAEVVDFARRGGFDTVDITGGAPELNPHLKDLILNLSGFVPRIMLRSNLTALTEGEGNALIELCKVHRVAMVASLPSLSQAQTESQRGRGVFGKSIATLRELNGAGYGHRGSGLELDLVSNPSGAFLPASQPQAERRFRQDLEKKWGVVFNHLYAIANVPLGRFRHWLVASGNFENYVNRLVENFNPCAANGLMCRTLVSVSWDGYLFDCDFNLASGLFLGGRKVHVSEVDGPPPPGSPIAVSDHCYACTAGPGFT
jgi:radical SAM/Cys-rich protein